MPLGIGCSREIGISFAQEMMVRNRLALRDHSQGCPMTTQEHLSVGVFDNLDTAERSIGELRAHGFRSDEIGIIGHVEGEQKPVSAPLDMKMPERNAMEGMWSGGLMGAVIGVLVVLVIPGLAAVAGAGRWFEVLGGAVLGAAVGGS